jgi:lipopolysaccharide transport system ATP-binding protein
MNIIELKGVSKKYTRKNYYLFNNEFFWALKDIELSIKKGEALGLIGSNGAGKSTLLRLVAGVTAPSEGNIRVNGKVIPVMNVEGALNYSLTARENILLLLSLFGVRGAEKKRLLEKIVSFAGIPEHLDMLLSKLSSGMVSRLSFSTAINVPGDILLIDEVLAVGDLTYQKRCLDELSDIKRSKRQ